jgi:regulator of sigma E protease
VTTLVAIGGLALLILVHEAGHFFVALAVGMRPRKFYLGFPPPLARVRRKGVEYGIGAIPLGGYVKIPGMYRPAGRDLGRWFLRAEDESAAVKERLVVLAATLDGGGYDAAGGDLDALEAAVRDAELSPSARTQAEKGIAELRDMVAPDAYWRQAAWRKIAVIFAGPATNLVLAVALFAAVFSVTVSAYRLGFSLQADGQAPSAVVADVQPGHPAAQAGLKAGDRVVAIGGRPVDALHISSTIRASKGRPIALTVVRDGKRVTLPPARAAHIVDAGESPPRAVWHAIRLTGTVTREIGSSLVNLVHAKQRSEISSPVGIVRGSKEAISQGARDYLGVLGLISLSLALLNLLPLLPLDGGHIAFSVVEALRRRAVPRAVYERASAVGIMLVLLLFFIGLSNDLGGGTGG